MSEDSPVLIPCLKGICLLSRENDPPHSWKGICQEGLSLTPKQFEPLKKELGEILELPMTAETMRYVKQEILETYRSLGYPLVAVQIPEQDITDGLIYYRIQESLLGDICVRGTKWSNPKRIADTVQLYTNEPINANVLASDLAWLNQNPYRSVNAIYRAGDKKGLTDIDLVVKEKTPISVFAGTDNTGFKETGYETVFAGFNWGNAFGLDHLLAFQYIASTHFHRYQAYAASYTAPLSWRHIFLVFGGYSFIHVPVFDEFFKNTGQSLQVSGRYQIPFSTHRDFLQEVRFGLDYKHTNNTVETGGAILINHFVNVFQFMAGYKWTFQLPSIKLFFDLEGYGSPAKLISDMSVSLYDELRFDAKPWYFYSRGTFSYEQDLPMKFKACAKLRGQVATANLLPSEQMGLGGYNTVRGYRERQVNVDNALIVNAEMRTPCISFFKKDSLVFLTFLDYGLGAQHIKSPTDLGTYNLLGVGPGLRYDIDHWVMTRADLAFRLIKTQNDAPNFIRIHFACIVNY